MATVKLPNNPSDGQDYSADQDYLVFNKEDNTWKLFGNLIKEKVVNKNNDGLITPKILNKLSSLYNLFNKGELKTFQLTNGKAYFYLLNNSDKLLKFIFDGNILWVEVNKSQLNSKINARTFCVGQTGKIGQTGQTGKNGIAAPNEKFISSSSGVIDVNVYIDNENFGPLSIRGYNKYRIKIFEILLSLNGEYTDENHYFKYITLNGNNLKAKLNDPSTILKISQVGLPGYNGNDGTNYVVATSYLNEIDIVKDAVLDFNFIGTNFIYNKQVLNIINCAFGVNAQELLSGSNWIGVEVTTSSCKIIEVVSPEIILDKIALDLPQWTPLPGCYDQSRYGMANFDWYSKLNLPFEILPNPEPKVNSCAIPFWFCGNSGNGPCDGSMSIFVPKKVYNNDLSSLSSGSLSSSSSSTSQSDQSGQSDQSASLSNMSSKSSVSKSSVSSLSHSSDSSQSLLSYSSESLSSDSSESLSSVSPLSPSSESLASPSSESLSSVSPLSPSSESLLSPLSPSSTSADAPCRTNGCVFTGHRFHFTETDLYPGYSSTSAWATVSTIKTSLSGSTPLGYNVCQLTYGANNVFGTSQTRVYVYIDWLNKRHWVYAESFDFGSGCGVSGNSGWIAGIPSYYSTNPTTCIPDGTSYTITNTHPYDRCFESGHPSTFTVTWL
jgi:hypothetical protein